HPLSVVSKSKVAFVSTTAGRYPAWPRSFERAIEKQAAWAAATSSSGFVPGSSPHRIAKLYATPFTAPLAVDTVLLSSFSPPRHCALARRCIEIPAAGIGRAPQRFLNRLVPGACSGE